MTTESSPFAIAVKQASRCPVEYNPLREIMQEEGRNLSPSQVAKEMLYNCKVLRRKDFTVQPLMQGSGMGFDPNSPKSKQRMAAL